MEMQQAVILTSSQKVWDPEQSRSFQTPTIPPCNRCNSAFICSKNHIFVSYSLGFVSPIVQLFSTYMQHQVTAQKLQGSSRNSYVAI